ncbi:uncharacterized protein [Dendropsophus ebraccatus]|uniref:uncharacterized protein n=1 Tax=Dendropsophus ebraccatus TaxID=150705 RepID=UPI003831C512
MDLLMSRDLTVMRRCRFLFEQLVILLHHHKCDKCEETESITKYSVIPLCPSMDATLSHMKHCRAGMSCQIPDCPSAREIMSHWRACRKEECPVALNLSKDRKQKIQLLLQAEVRSFSDSICYHLNIQLITLFRKHRCHECVFHQLPMDLPLCHSVDAMLSHMKYCTAGMSCKIPECPAVRRIISHWKNCKDQDCPVAWNLGKDRHKNMQKEMSQKALLLSVMYSNRCTPKNIRQTLFVIFHAWSCMNRQTSAGLVSNCDLPQCRTMQALLRHAMSCAGGDHCLYLNCNTTRYIFIHYMSCVLRDCAVCWPVRSVIKQLCGTDDPSNGRPHYQQWKGISIIPTNIMGPWVTIQIYRWILTKNKPLIGPPLFQEEVRRKRRCAPMTWQESFSNLNKRMRMASFRWRYCRSTRTQICLRGRDVSNSPSVAIIMGI